MRREVDLAGLGDLLHARRETDRVSLRGVVHVEVVADLADDHFAGVETQAHREVQPAAQAQLVGVSAQAVHHMQRGITGAARVILVRDRRAKERHDAVAGELVDEALEALHTVRENLEKAVHDLRPLFRVELLGQLHRALHIGEQDRDLLAFAFQRGARGQDLVGEVFGSVSAWRGFCRRFAVYRASLTAKRRRALAAEVKSRRIFERAIWTGETERCSTFPAELHPRWIFEAAF
jgi:hypothetical protein